MNVCKTNSAGVDGGPSRGSSVGASRIFSAKMSVLLYINICSNINIYSNTKECRHSVKELGYRSTVQQCITVCVPHISTGNKASHFLCSFTNKKSIKKTMTTNVNWVGRD